MSVLPVLISFKGKNIQKNNDNTTQQITFSTTNPKRKLLFIVIFLIFKYFDIKYFYIYTCIFRKATVYLYNSLSLAYFPLATNFFSMQICFKSVKKCLSRCECTSALVRVRVCCFDTQRQTFSENWSPDTVEQQVKAFFLVFVWCLVLLQPLLDHRTGLQSVCVCKCLCALESKERGFLCVPFSVKQGKSLRPGLVLCFYQQSMGQNIRAVEKSVFLWSPVGRSARMGMFLCASKTGCQMCDNLGVTRWW